MTHYISTTDTAALLRADLKTAWPGVKFSVRKSTGTGSAWIHIRYTDGPTSNTLRAFTDNYQGRQFNGMTDSYDDRGTLLLLTAGEELPEEVRFSCDGINNQRYYSPAAYLHAQHILDETGHSDIRVCTETGEPITDGPVPPMVVLPGRVYDYLYSPAGLAERILADIDLSTITTGEAR
jgi:hypothetical protein